MESVIQVVRDVAIIILALESIVLLLALIVLAWQAWKLVGLVRKHVVDGGMLPKIDAALNALDGGAARVRIVDGRRPHAVGLALLSGESLGTEIVL